MSLLAWAILVVLLLGAVFAAAVLVDRSRSARLRNRFGPEYERTLHEVGDRRSTERDWMETGASPPTGTLPTWICRLTRRVPTGRGGAAGMPRVTVTMSSLACRILDRQ
ncbi:hypothetical protein FrEUN1fDRAFT_7765, partial [Parafrankia sp. EUN1f]